jgi:hypothetical protein
MCSQVWDYTCQAGQEAVAWMLRLQGVWGRRRACNYLKDSRR